VDVCFSVAAVAAGRADGIDAPEPVPPCDSLRSDLKELRYLAWGEQADVQGCHGARPPPGVIAMNDFVIETIQLYFLQVNCSSN
jgi:hypothetical protein